jgi:hypothetical protein
MLFTLRSIVLFSSSIAASPCVCGPVTSVPRADERAETGRDAGLRCRRSWCRAAAMQATRNGRRPLGSLTELFGPPTLAGPVGHAAPPHPCRLHPDWRERAPTQASSSCVSGLCPPESGPSASDLRAPDDRTVSWKRDVRAFHKGNFPSSRSFLIHLDASWLDPFTNVLPRTTLDPPFPVTRVIRLALQVLFRSPTLAWASRPASLTLIGLLIRLGRPGPMQVSWGHA